MPVILVLFKIIMFPSVIQAIFGAFLFWILIYLHEFFTRREQYKQLLLENRGLFVAEDDSAGKFFGTKMYYLAFER